MGEVSVSGLMSVDDFVGISETPEGLHKQMEKALEYTSAWYMESGSEREKIITTSSCM